ncbi:hypothetical protein PF008_g33096, partial [Phytophthora fragariae]
MARILLASAVSFSSSLVRLAPTVSRKLGRSVPPRRFDDVWSLGYLAASRSSRLTVAAASVAGCCVGSEAPPLVALTAALRDGGGPPEPERGALGPARPGAGCGVWARSSRPSMPSGDVSKSRNSPRLIERLDTVDSSSSDSPEP